MTREHAIRNTFHEQIVMGIARRRITAAVELQTRPGAPNSVFKFSANAAKCSLAYRVPQPRRASHAARVSMTIADDARADAIRKDISGQRRGDILCERRDIGHPSTKHDDVWVKNVDHSR